LTNVWRNVYNCGVNIVNAGSHSRWFLRPGTGEHALLDRLLTPDLFSGALNLEGLILDAPRIPAYGDVRKKLPLTTAVIVDPQVYRLQKSSCADHRGLTKLGYYPDGNPLGAESFLSPAFTAEFVSKVLDEQHAIQPTSYVAPAFYVDSSSPAWAEVNTRLLQETLRQVGQKVFATLCGSYATLCRTVDPGPIAQSISLRGVEGVLVLVSPLTALTDSSTKLANYLRLLKSLRSTGLEVVACRQPAFGLGCMALGVSGFDCGIGTAERFDFASLTRPVRMAVARTDGKPARKKSVYLPQVLTSVRSAVADAIFSTSGVAGSFVCNQGCCRDNIKTAIARSREHFLYTRSWEVNEMKSLSMGWRYEHFNQTLVAARQMAEKILRAFPGSPHTQFRHLDTWSGVLAEASEGLRRGA